MHTRIIFFNSRHFTYLVEVYIAVKKVLFLAPLILLTLLVAIKLPVATSKPETVTIAVDLAHGESDKYLNFIQGNITQVTVNNRVYSIKWINITTGMTITQELLSEVDILLIGQPTTGLSPDEMEAILDWLKGGNKVLYVAGDSDYGPGPDRIDIVNKLLEYIGARLRLEQASVYSEVGRTYKYKGTVYPTVAAAYYRVLVFVEPDSTTLPHLDTSILAEGITKPILMHGPTCVVWVDDEGHYHDPVTEVFPGLIRIAWFRNSYIGDNNPPPAYVYDPMFYGLGAPRDNSSFVGYAAEYWLDVNSLITVAGESLYGDYEPAWASSYYGVSLDGPAFVENLIRWWIRVVTYTPPPPPTLTVTETATVMQTITHTVTRTLTQTVTETMTLTTTQMQTMLQTIRETTTKVSLETLSTTITVTAPDYTVAGVVGGVALIIIVILVIMLFTRKK